MGQDQALDVKLESFFEKLDKRLESMENKLDNRLTIVESQCNNLERKQKKQQKFCTKVGSEVDKLKISVAVLEQERLERNVIIKGVPELQNEDSVALEDKVESIFCFLDTDFESQYLTSVRRIGNNKDKNKNRLIVAQLSDVTIKSKVMKGLAAKNMNCSHFTYTSGMEWGSSDKKIYLSDDLTPTMSKVYYHARQLKKQKIVKYAWTKLGRIYVKEKDDSRAYKISSMEQLADFKQKVLDQGQAEEDDSNDSDTSEQATEMDTESEALSETATKKSTDSKRQRSPDKQKQKSPRPKRHKNTKKK